MSRQEEQLDAAEYVIGTLSVVERMAFEAALEADGQARDDVRFWENVFGDLSASIPEAELSSDVWPEIEKRLADGQVDNAGQLASSLAARTAAVGGTAALDTTNNPTVAGVETSAASTPVASNDNSMRRSRGLWRAGAIAASIAALGLGAALFNGDVRTRVDNVISAGLTNKAGEENLAIGSAKSYIAVVNAPDQPAMIVKVDPQSGNVSVRSLGVEKPQGKSLELWYVAEGAQPVSMGLVDEGEIKLGDLKAKNGDLLAISVEPAGGSPEATATGPVIYTGKLIEDAQ